MAVDKDYLAFVLEQLSVIGPVRSRAMFGGAGIYSGDTMFALIADETLYLKADEKTVPAFEAEDTEPFTYEGKGKSIQMSYWRCPERLFEDAEDMQEWAEASRAAAERGKSRKPAKPKKRKKSD